MKPTREPGGSNAEEIVRPARERAEDADKEPRR